MIDKIMNRIQDLSGIEKKEKPLTENFDVVDSVNAEDLKSINESINNIFELLKKFKDKTHDKKKKV